VFESSKTTATLFEKINQNINTAMNRLKEVFLKKQGNLLNVYFTAGYPTLNSTRPLLDALQHAGADMIEIGMPFSDPLADGPIIQASSTRALNNGMTIALLFEQLAGMREHIQLPVLLMGYLNPVMQYGIERFCADCEKTGIDGLILPDLPLDEYEREFKTLFEKHHLAAVFLVTPQTSEARIRKIDELSTAFIYLVSIASTTGTKDAAQSQTQAYLQRVASMGLKSPTMVGFGIRDKAGFELACRYTQGAIVGSAFIEALDGAQEKDFPALCKSFVARFKSPVSAT
jgi:tryptophan synthase alpha chain